MKRLRLTRRGQLLQACSGTSSTERPALASRATQHLLSSSASIHTTPRQCQALAADVPAASLHPADVLEQRQPLPSPPHQRASSSPKLAALHARLSLSQKIPLETLARALVNPSADPHPNYNNANLSFLGSSIINYHVLEYLVCKWPRLPMAILYETLRAYAGKESLHSVARRWGVDSAAVPGEEVDPGMLQWSAQGQQFTTTRWGYMRSAGEREQNYRRGMSSRVVMDDPFGDAVHHNSNNLTAEENLEQSRDRAFESFVHAVVGAIQLHCGREAAKTFVNSHILSRQVDPSKLFAFKLPTRELAMLCAREGFEPPLARLESETGRRSRTPVFVVGVYSGKEKLGEGVGSSLDMARKVASMNALKAWYLYSPGNKVRVPSDMLEEGAKPWTAPHIDIGEII